MQVTQLLCKRPDCGKVVPPSRGKGRKRLYCSLRCKSIYSSRLYYAQRREEEGYVSDPTPEPVVCRNETCSNMVPPSRFRGKPRVYCSLRCSTQHWSREYYRRRTGKTGDGLYKTINDQPYISRIKPPTAQAAETRFKNHLEKCAVHGGKCPARFDPFDLKRECLMHAVLREDWDEIRRAGKGMVFTRRVTTDNGFWIDAPAEVVDDPSLSGP